MAKFETERDRIEEDDRRKSEGDGADAGGIAGAIAGALAGAAGGPAGSLLGASVGGMGGALIGLMNEDDEQDTVSET